MTGTTKVDPITLEVVRNALVAYCDEMAVALRRTAYNPMIFEVQDYCVGLVDAAGELIAQNAGGLPIFLADLGVSVADGIERFGVDGFSPGDVLVMNYPYVAGQHLNNVVVYTPIIIDGEVFGFPAIRAHWVDIGGARIGFGSTATTDIYAEGLQLRSIKVMKGGVWDDDVMQIIKDNLRLPHLAMGDLRAAIAGCRLGERRITELVERYGKQVIKDCIAEARDQSERLSRSAVARMADGEYHASAWMDDDGQDIGTPITLDIRVVIEGDEMTVDFSRINEQVKGPLNSGESGGVAAARVAFKTLTLPTHPVDEGSFRNLKVILPPGKLLNARPPAALGQWSISLPTVVDTIVAALADAMPEKVPAAHKGDMAGYTFYGQDARTGERYVCLNINGGGWGGRPTGDGPSASVSVCQGDVRNIPIEIQETRFPLEFGQLALRADSGGAGEHRGGLGLEIVVEPQQQVFTNIANERTTCPPWGLRGGAAGAVNETVVTPPGGEPTAIKKSTGHALQPGSQVVFRTAGGGGWGDPLDRPVELVREDYLDELISWAAAQEEYGVRFADDGSVDEAGTKAIREQRRR